jgi:uncharacterized protein YbcI
MDAHTPVGWRRLATAMTMRSARSRAPYPVSNSIHFEQQNRDEILAGIADELVRAHARSCGSAPGWVRISWDENFLVCVLERVLTTPERALIAAGRFDRVRADREALREALEPSLRALVEARTGRAVQAYLTAVGTDDIGFEAFMLG